MIDEITRMHAAVGLGPVAADAGPRFVVGARLRDGDVEHQDALDRRVERAVVITRTAAPCAGADAARFLRGARIAARLEHPGIATILALGVDDDGHPYYVRPRRRVVAFDRFCAGDGGGAPPLGRRLTALVDVARAVAHAHDRGVAHGRLTPAAVVIGEGGDARVVDWDHAEVSGTRLGRVDDLGPPAASATSAPATAAGDLAALHALLAIAVGPDADAAPELTALAAPSALGLAQALVEFQGGARDQALRRERAAAVLADAERALTAARPRDVALALARRALALDPDSDRAAALVTRLLLELPAPLPPAAQAAVARSDGEVMRQLGIGFIGAFGAFALYVPIMLAQGVRAPATVAAVAVTAGAMLAWALRWRWRGPHVFTWPPMLGAAAVMFLYARTYGPFVNAPAQAALATMAVMFFPSRPRLLAVVATFAVPVFGNLALEHLGVFARTTHTAADALVVTSPTVTIEPVSTYVGLLFVSVVLVTVAGAMAGYVAATQRRHTRTLVALTWRLRALAAADPPRSRTTSRPPT